MITVRWQSKEDLGYRDIFLIPLDGESLRMLRHCETVIREAPPDAKRLQAYNTLV